MADEVLERLRTQLIGGLTVPVIKQLLDDLRKEKVLNEEEAETILEENPARADKARKLIDSVKKKGSVASGIMIAKLKAHDGQLYNKLELDRLLQVDDERPPPGAPAIPLTETDYDTSKEYRMESSPRGLCVIINNVDFKNPDKDRKGSDNDADALNKVFTRLGFVVRRHENQTAKQMRELMLHYSKTNEHGDCFVCCMLSHGEKEGVKGTDKKTCSMKDILNPFDGKNCPSLVGKPKVFFIQACRGHNRQEKVPVTTDEDEVEADDDSVTSDDLGEPYTIPRHSDFLVSMSTVEDYVSYRSSGGSWFIQSLCSHLKEGSQRGDDILTILTEVNDDVSRREGIEVNQDGTTCDAKMTPEPRFTLRKKLIFRIP